MSRNKSSKHRVAEKRSPIAPEPIAKSSNAIEWLHAIVRWGLVAIIVFVLFLPADSVLVEDGGALPHQAYAIILTSLGLGILLSQNKSGNDTLRWSGWLLAAFIVWLVLSTISESGSGNLRAALHKLWIWIGGCGLFVATRSVRWQPRDQRTLIAWFVLSATLLSCHAAWQVKVEFPANRAAYFADPEKTARMVGITDTQDSDAHRIFMDRLFSTEPFATFALPNSLAAVLMLALVVLLGLLLARDLRTSSQLVWICWILVLLLLVAMLLATKSRTAVIATTIVLFGLMLHRWVGWRISAWLDRRRWAIQDATNGVREASSVSGRKAMLGIATLAIIIIGGGLYAASRWDDRLLSEASMSLRFRTQYWLSTLAMIQDHPWFGVGPGGFRLAYPYYRAEGAAEVVADPHNWILELIASAGIPGALLALAAFFAFASQVLRQSFSRPSSTFDLEAFPARDPSHHVPIWSYDLAAGCGFVSAIIWGLTQGFVLPWYLYMVLVPIAFGIRWLLRSWIEQGALPNAPIIAGLVAMGINLLAAGGLTIPGVIFPFIVLVGCWLAADPLKNLMTSTPSRLAVAFAYFIPLSLVFLFWQTSWSPVREANRYMEEGERWLGQGEMSRAVAAFQRASTIDRYNPNPAVLLAITYGNQILLESGQGPREALRQACDQAAQKASHDHAILRRLGDVWMEIYQQHGERIDLEQASTWYLRAVERHPTDLLLLAQAAVVLNALGHKDKSEAMAKRARDLDELSSNDLAHTNILRPETIKRGGRIPWMVKATELLPNQ